MSWLCLMGAIYLLCEWSHEPFANLVGTSRQQTGRTACEGASPFWQASSTDHVSDGNKEIQSLRPTRIVNLSVKICEILRPTNVVQDEQRGKRQRVIAAFDEVKRCTKVHCVRKVKRDMNGVVKGKLITFPLLPELIHNSRFSEQRRRKLSTQNLD